jgi:sugar phosphate isomerase/epimerase
LAGAGLAALPSRTRDLAGLKIGVRDSVVGAAGKPEAIAIAAKLGFEGVELNIGMPDPAGNLALMEAGLQTRFLEESKEHRIALASTCLEILHINCLKNDELGKKWVRQGIDVTRKVKARVMLLPCAYKCALLNRAEMDAAAEALRELAPVAEDAGVILGLESLLTAGENLYVLDKVKSTAVRIYNDVGNLTNLAGLDAANEIRQLGRRICQIHLKDRGYLGEGKVNFPEVLRALRDIGYQGWGVLETNWPSNSMETDTRRNLNFLRGAIRQVEGS